MNVDIPEVGWSLVATLPPGGKNQETCEFAESGKSTRADMAAALPHRQTGANKSFSKTDLSANKNNP